MMSHFFIIESRVWLNQAESILLDSFLISTQMDPRKFFSTNTLMGREEHKKASQLLDNLMASPDSFEFRQPVDYLGFGLLDYPTIVKRPMDLGTVKRNLNNNTYETVESCLADIQLIWENCKLYNTNDNVLMR